MFEVLKTEGKARRGVFTCAHGTVQTPVFMNVGTQGAIKGAVSAHDLKEIGCQVELSNTYHLHLRPGDQVVRQMGGLHRFMRWDGPILTDSGGFQVFSLSGLRKIKEEGVTFASHIDGRRIFMGPEESMQIQSNLGSDIAMAFDECVENPATYEYAKASCERTLRWLARCKAEHDRLNALPDTVNPRQMLFGINQGATFPELRIWHMKETAKIDCEGYAIGGLAVGEPTQVMYDIIDAVEPYMPAEKPRYLMGVGTPSNIIEGVARGVDFFDVKAFGADFAYTMDGGFEGELEYENFNAASAKIEIQGRNVHPGYAKDKMINAIQVACELNALLPAWERPEHTEGYDGFYHCIALNGTVDQAQISYIVRDHDSARFEARKNYMQECVDLLVRKYGEGVLTLTLKDSYYNMRKMVEPHPQVIDKAIEAMKMAGVEPLVKPIRGGTDGARLSFMGLPCPNIFTGGMNFHGRYEYCSLTTMHKAMQVILNLAQLWTK